MLERLKDRVYVAPAINFPLTSCTGEAIPYGLTPEMAAKKGLKREVDIACKAMTEMHQRGIRVLPGGDYGFAWAPHGTYGTSVGGAKTIRVMLIISTWCSQRSCTLRQPIWLHSERKSDCRDCSRRRDHGIPRVTWQGAAWVLR